MPQQQGAAYERHRWMQITDQNELDAMRFKQVFAFEKLNQNIQMKTFETHMFFY